MFHNLIYNKDPNLGNWLVDPAWNVILIDNSRAFTPVTRMTHEMTRIDRELWSRSLALDEAVLESALGEWFGGREIRGILERRDEMAELIEGWSRNGARAPSSSSSPNADCTVFSNEPSGTSLQPALPLAPTGRS